MFRDLPRYDTYARILVAWAPPLPAHWTIERGKSLFRRVQRVPNESDGVVTCFRDGVVTLRSRRRTSGFTESVKEIGYQGIRRGDLVIHAMDAFAGAVGVSDSDGKGTPVYSVCVPRRDANPHYFAAVVREMARTSWIQSLAKGVRERSTDFRFEAFGGQFLPVPPPEEQAAIVKYLAHANARIDKAIAAKRRLITLLEEQSSGLRDQALRSGDWPRRRLKTLIDRVDQGVSPQAENQEPGPGEWGVLKSGCVNGGSFRADQVKRLPDGFAIPEAMSVREGDLLVSRANGSPHLVGSAARVSGLKHQAILSDKTFRLIPSPTVDADFLALSMNAQAYRQQVRTAISGAEGLANNLPLSALKTFEFVVPPFQFQRELVRMVEEELSTLRLTMNRVTSEIALLQEFRTRLVADVVTGQVDVRAIATTLADVPECKSRHLDDPIHTLESDTREDEVADE